MIQRLFIISLAWLASSLCTVAEVLKHGTPISVVSSAMTSAGHERTALAIMPWSGEDLQFWQMDQGVLIVRYSTESRQIVGLTYSFSDERPKGMRKTFDLNVLSFDTSTGQMTILIPQHAPGKQHEDARLPVR